MSSSSFSRRAFMGAIGGTALAAVAGRRVFAAAADIQFGYASITWGGHDDQAIADIAAAGYSGIQLRANILKEYGDKPNALADRLAAAHLAFVALSSGGVNIDPARRDEQIELHVGHAKFLKACGGKYLQVTDNRPKRTVTPDDYRSLGALMTEIGKRTADLGIPLGYHNHMNNLGERPEEVDRILDAADPTFVRFELDVAHYRMGGGKPAEAIRKYAERLLFLHIKDLETPVPGATGDLSRSYRFVELGRGVVDLPACVAALKDISFKGWCIVELDAVPDKARTPKESALASKKYIEDTLGLRV
jgi:inosose dehydratase